MASIESILRAVGELGPKPTLLYGMYQILLRLGWLKWRTPQFDWQDASLAHWLSPGFSSDPEDYLELRVRNNKCFFFHPDDEFIHALRQLSLSAHDRVAPLASFGLAFNPNTTPEFESSGFCFPLKEILSSVGNSDSGTGPFTISKSIGYLIS